MTIQSEQSSEGSKFTNMLRNNWKPIFELHFSKNSTKAIRLSALDFYEVIVNSAFGLISYQLDRNLELII